MTELINPLPHPPTQEQIDVVHAVMDNRVVKVDAISGSGKTSSLQLIANNIQRDSLYLTFSKALAVEASEKFPEWVDVRTVHSLAFREVGKYYAHKLSRPDGGYKNVAATGTEIAKYFRMASVEFEDGFISKSWLGLMVKQTLAKYEASADEFIESSHLPHGEINQKKKMLLKKMDKSVVDNTMKQIEQRLLDYAGRLWEERINQDSPVLITHDTYVKMYGLTNPYIDTDVIYLDESQDSSAVMLDLVMKQDHCKVVLVGDKDQNIYGWRHSVNAMEQVDCAEAYLSQSFRYGEQIADIASLVLNGREVKGWTTPSIAALDGVVGDHKYTKLFRTNGYLLASALPLIEDGVKVNIETDLYDFIRVLRSSEALFKGKLKSVKHEDIACYLNWKEMREEAEGDPALGRIVKIVESGQVGRYISILNKHKNTKDPDVTLCTAHKAKGREWDYVILADDFGSNYNSDGKWEGLPDGERRLLYVALTRARLGLEYNSTVAEFIEGMEVSKRKVQSTSIPVGSISLYESNNFGSNCIPSTPRGEMAMDSYLNSMMEESGLEEYAAGGMSQEEAFDLGIVDESGFVRETEAFEEALDRVDFIPNNEEMQKLKLILEK